MSTLAMGPTEENNIPSGQTTSSTDKLRDLETFVDLNKKKSDLKRLFMNFRNDHATVDERDFRRCIRKSGIPFGDSDVEKAIRRFNVNTGVDYEKFLANLKCDGRVWKLAANKGPRSALFSPRSSGVSTPASSRPGTPSSFRDTNGSSAMRTTGKSSGGGGVVRLASRPTGEFGGQPKRKDSSDETKRGEKRPTAKPREAWSSQNQNSNNSLPKPKESHRAERPPSSSSTSSSASSEAKPKSRSSAKSRPSYMQNVNEKQLNERLRIREIQSKLDNYEDLLRDKLRSKTNGGPFEIRRAWRRFDTEMKGVLDIEALGKVMSGYGFKLTNEELGMLMDRFDEDGNGEIDYNEFVQRVLWTEHPPFTKPTTADKEVEQVQLENYDPPKPSRKVLELETQIRDKVNAKTRGGPYQVRKAFKYFDRDGSGGITYEEFKVTLESFGIFTTDEEFGELVRRYDANGDGMIDFSEFSKLVLGDALLPTSKLGLPGVRPPWGLIDDLFRLKNQTALTIEEKFKTFERILRRHDKGNKGYLTYKEFEDAVSAAGFHLTPAEMKGLILNADKDGDGTISRKEFCSAFSIDQFHTLQMFQPRGWRGSGDIIAYRTEPTRVESEAQMRKLRQTAKSDVIGPSQTTQSGLKIMSDDELSVDSFSSALRDTMKFGNVEDDDAVRRNETRTLVAQQKKTAPVGRKLKKKSGEYPLPSDKNKEFRYGVEPTPREETMNGLMGNEYYWRWKLEREQEKKRQAKARVVNHKEKRFHTKSSEYRESLSRAQRQGEAFVVKAW